MSLKIPHNQIAIPARGMIDFRDVLTSLVDEFDTDDDDSDEGEDNDNRITSLNLLYSFYWNQ